MTDWGTLELKLSTFYQRQFQLNSSYLYINEYCVTYKKKNKLWLPPDYLSSCPAVRNNILALGLNSDQVIFLEVDLDQYLPDCRAHFPNRGPFLGEWFISDSFTRP